MEPFIIITTNQDTVKLLCSECGATFEVAKSKIEEKIECKECDNSGEIK